MTISVEASMLEEARAEVAPADHKASMVLAALGIGFGALLGGLLARDWEPSDLDSIGEWFWWPGALLSLASIAVAASAVWPRFRADDVSEGIYYWGHVATFDSVEALRTALDGSPPMREERTLHQLWHLSKIVRKKYKRVRWAIGLGGAAACLFLLASVIGG